MNFDAASTETFQILRSFDYEVILYDDDGKQVFEPTDARRFFAKPENLLVSIVDANEDSSVRLYLSKSTDINSVMGMIDSLRAMATKYNMIFHVRKHGRVLSPKDFSTRAAVTESKDKHMKVLEGMYGTSRSSYLKLENARMIVRHSARINENTLGARGRNVEHIYIENGVGERHLFPTTHLAPARALAHHVSNGGSWADEVGEQIARMAQDFANLMQASRHIHLCGNNLSEEAHGIRSRIRESIRGLRRTFECICRKTRYDETIQTIMDCATTLNETECASKVQELAGIINTEDRALDEDVLSSVAQALESEGKKDDSAETVVVLGRPVNKSAWNEFKKGKLELVSDIVLAKAPTFSTRATQYSFVLSLVSEKCKDDSMALFLEYVSEQLAATKDQAKAKNLKRVADVAFHAAGIRFANEVPKTEAVKEFANWIDSFNTNAVLVEMMTETDEEDFLDDFESEIPEGQELSQEDILLPKGQEEDLMGEVMPATVDDPDSGEEVLPDDSYVHRLQSLAGLQRKV